MFAWQRDRLFFCDVGFEKASIVIPVIGLVIAVLGCLISADGNVSDNVQDEIAMVRSGQNHCFAEPPTENFAQGLAILRIGDSYVGPNMTKEVLVSSIRIQGSMDGHISPARQDSPNRVLTHMYEFIVHAMPVSSNKLAVYFERAWELSLTTANELFQLEGGIQGESLFNVLETPRHIGARRVSTDFALKMLSGSHAISDRALENVAYEAQWHVSSLSGKTVHLVFHEDLLSVEPRDCTLSFDDVDWFHYTKLPELIASRCFEHDMKPAQIASHLNNFMPTELLFLGSDESLESTDGDRQILEWNVHPYSFEASFPMLAFLDSAFSLTKAGKARFRLSHVIQTLDDLNEDQRTRLSL